MAVSNENVLMMILRVMICHYVFKVCRLVLNVNRGMCWYNSVSMPSQDDIILCRRKVQSATLSLSTKFLYMAVCSAARPAPVL
jgi:hypothetical protein